MAGECWPAKQAKAAVAASQPPASSRKTLKATVTYLEALYKTTKGNTMNEQVKPQGVFITAEFDRIVSRERRDKDNKIIVTKYVGLIARSDESTELYLVRTGRPEKYANVKRNEMLTLKVNVRSFRDVIYYSEV